MTATPSPSPAHIPAASAGAAVERVRPLRAVMAAVLVLGPLLFIVASLLSPYDMTEDKVANIVADIAAHEGQEKAAAWVWLALGIAMTAAAVLVSVYVMARSPKLGLAGLLLFGGGAVAVNLTPSYDFVTLAGLDKGVPQAEIVKVLKGGDSLAMPAVAGIWFIAGIVIGVVVLGIGLLRSHAVPAWAAWVLMVSMPVNVVGWMTGVAALAYAGFALLTVAFAVVAQDIARHGTGWVRAAT
ncbi:hypothetical protein [Streptomyces endophyticus]|uniref:DUF4386 family protein n=1 Tax=Streptomyces endophyticus TaxID=714166 RepID=A0ABU6F400_9ACTN|nr:hypothetical protein [Streptomyces endophyticus]MEB8338569.1 hypothetical protein [Streptomyces endophyticus]